MQTKPPFKFRETTLFGSGNADTTQLACADSAPFRDHRQQSLGALLPAPGWSGLSMHGTERPVRPGHARHREARPSRSRTTERPVRPGQGSACMAQRGPSVPVRAQLRVLQRSGR